MDKKGTHTIQSILDVMTMAEEESILAADIQGHVVEMAKVRGGITGIGPAGYTRRPKSALKFLRDA